MTVSTATFTRGDFTANVFVEFIEGKECHKWFVTNSGNQVLASNRYSHATARLAKAAAGRALLRIAP